MGEHQCTVCGHITTGFEQTEFEAKRDADAAKDARISALLAENEEMRGEIERLHAFTAWCISRQFDSRDLAMRAQSALFPTPCAALDSGRQG